MTWGVTGFFEGC